MTNVLRQDKDTVTPLMLSIIQQHGPVTALEALRLACTKFAQQPKTGLPIWQQRVVNGELHRLAKEIGKIRHEFVDLPKFQDEIDLPT